MRYLLTRGDVFLDKITQPLECSTRCRVLAQLQDAWRSLAKEPGPLFIGQGAGGREPLIGQDLGWAGRGQAGSARAVFGLSTLGQIFQLCKFFSTIHPYWNSYFMSSKFVKKMASTIFEDKLVRVKILHVKKYHLVWLYFEYCIRCIWWVIVSYRFQVQ